jgi:hypothetical protein
MKRVIATLIWIRVRNTIESQLILIIPRGFGEWRR